MSEKRRGPDRRATAATGEVPVLPHSIEAEAAILGAVLMQNPVLLTLPDGFGEGVFFRDAHRFIYRAFVELHKRQMAIDLLTVKSELLRTGALDRVGGPVYLAQLIDGVPRSMNAPYYAQIVMEHATRRQIIELADTVRTDAYLGELPADALVAKAQQGIIEVSDLGTRNTAAHIATLVPEFRSQMEQAAERHEPVIGTSTGYPELDAVTAGLQRGDMIVLAARPSMGKTALAMNLADHTSERDLVLVFSAEMKKQALLQRLASARARVEGHSIRTGRLSADELERLRFAMTQVEQLQLVIDDNPNLMVEDLPRRARRVMLEHGKLALLIIDYIQLLGTRAIFENRTQQVSAISHGIKGLARDLDVPVVALSQLSRLVEGRKDKKPMLSDLRESGSLEQDADVVIFIHRPDPNNDEDPAQLIIAKQRNGPVTTIRLMFHSTYTRFDSIDYRNARADD